jgi:hypothetical protein
MKALSNILTLLTPILIGGVVLPLVNILLLPKLGFRVIDAGPGTAGHERLSLELVLYAVVGLAFFTFFLVKKKVLRAGLLLAGLLIGGGLTYVGSLVAYLMITCSTTAGGC